MRRGAITLRRYEASDENAAIALWLRCWEATYPDINFAARLEWWRTRWRNELVGKAEIVIAEAETAEERAMVGFVTVDPETRYLDQLVVAPQCWREGVGRALIVEAKRISPAGLELDVNTDNARAIGFYERQGFAIVGEGLNPLSGRPVHRMRWGP